MRWIWMGILLAGMLSACANVSRLEKGSLVAHGELLDGAQEPLYYSIWVDFNKPVDTRIMGSLNLPRISGHRVKPQVRKFRIPAALHIRVPSDAFFGCRRFLCNQTGCWLLVTC